MATKKLAAPFVLSEALINAYAVNNRINVFLIKSLPEEAWRALPPNGKGRTIAAIAAHMHNVRLMWLKAVGARTLPEKLERSEVSRAEAISALEQSWQALQDVLRQSIQADGRVKGFKPDVAGFFGYLVAHDSHHRGQIAMLARQAGHPIPQSAMFGMWEWGSR